MTKAARKAAANAGPARAFAELSGHRTVELTAEKSRQLIKNCSHSCGQGEQLILTGNLFFIA